MYSRAKDKTSDICSLEVADVVMAISGSHKFADNTRCRITINFELWKFNKIESPVTENSAIRSM